MKGLMDIFKDIAERYPAEPPVEELESDPVYYCDICRDHRVERPDAICPQCAIDQARGYCVRSLAGRCANGSELDHGTRFHALPTTGQTWRALCGTKPGRRSVGWVTWGADQAVTCPRCIKKLEAMKGNQIMSKTPYRPTGKGDTTQGERSARREALLNVAAQRMGKDSWSAVETAFREAVEKGGGTGIDVQVSIMALLNSLHDNAFCQALDPTQGTQDVAEALAAHPKKARWTPEEILRREG
jgi:hypothetical protein